MRFSNGYRTGLIGSILLASLFCIRSEGAVSVSTSASGVQLGQALTIQASTDETDTIIGVTFSYEGTDIVDYDSSPPYQVSRSFDWATLEDLEITATFDFEKIDPQTGAAEVNVVDIVLMGSSSPVFSTKCLYRGFAQPTGISVSTWNWSYSNTTVGSKGIEYCDTSNSDYISIWMGRMVDSGTIEISASVLGVPCTKTLDVNVQNRTSYDTLSLSCVEDNDPEWEIPLIGAVEEALSKSRDKDTDLSLLIVPQTSDDDWSDGITVSEITTGPNTGYWYITSYSLGIDRETVINAVLKSDGENPGGASENIYTHNNAIGRCQESTMDDYVQALRNHEYRGTPPTAMSLEGHFGRCEYYVANSPFPFTTLLNYKGLSQQSVLKQANDLIKVYEDALSGFANDGDWGYGQGPNWGGSGSLGSGRIDTWDYNSSQWNSGCSYGPSMF